LELKGTIGPLPPPHITHDAERPQTRENMLQTRPAWQDEMKKEIENVFKLA
jgi:hypothetical protein